MRHVIAALASVPDAQVLLSTNGLFPPEFLRGATVLLASYDPESAQATASPDSATA